MAQTLWSRSRKPVVGIVSLVGVLATAACAPTSNTASGSDDSVLTVALPGTLSNLFPGQEAGILNYYVAGITQEGLVGVDANGDIVPALAESWEQTAPDTYVYELRDNAEFQDGSAVTVDDVITSIEQTQDPTVAPNLAGSLQGIESLEETADGQLTVTLTEPDASFAWALSTASSLFVAPQSFWEEHQGAIGTTESLLIGTGPYQVSEFRADTGVTLDRVDTWWGGTPEYEQIRVEFIPDDNTRLLAQQAGDVDISFNVPFSQLAEWQSIDGTSVEFISDLSQVGLYFDTAVAPFDDEHVRAAIAHSVDRPTIVENLLDGHGEPASAFPSPDSLVSALGEDGTETALAGIPTLEFDLDTARSELAQSEYPDGFSATISYPNTGQQLGEAAQLLAQNLAEIGIDLTVEEVPIEQWFTQFGDGTTGIGFTWYFSTTGDPGELVNNYLGADNVASFDDAQVEELLASARAETDPATRAEQLLEANSIANQAVAYVPLWWGESAIAVSDDIVIDNLTSFWLTGAWPAQITPA